MDKEKKSLIIGVIVLIIVYIVVDYGVSDKSDPPETPAGSFALQHLAKPTPPILEEAEEAEEEEEEEEDYDEYDKEITIEDLEKFRFDDNENDFEMPDIPLYSQQQSIAWCDKTPQEVIDEGKMVLLGGIGGSGTRAVHSFCAHFGWLGGSWVTNQGDSSECFIRNMKLLMRAGGSLENSFYAYRAGREEDIRNQMDSKWCLGEKGFLDEGHGSCFFGFKNPPAIYQMRYFKIIYPETKLIHIIRDGRDMAFSENDMQTRELGPWTLTLKEMKLSMNERQAVFWSKSNMAIREAALSLLGSENYLIVRIEDLIQPHDEKLRLDTMAQIASFLLDKPISHDVVREYAGIFQSTSLGRWRTHPEHITSKIEQLCKEGLEVFGYL